ncbi:MAG: hypothetical protein MJ132_03915 [Clostridia bacterium]|nr:hypothetical protein [Clostridia bacterium]
MSKFKIILLIPTAILAVLLSGCKKGKANDTKETLETGWVVTQAATCTKDGVETKTDASGKTETKVIHATGHTVVEDEAIPATCTEDGLTEGSHCEICGEVLEEQQVISAHHTAVTKRGVAPTCTRAGRSTSQYCKICGAEVVEEVKIRPLDHHFANGYCTRCHVQKPDCIELDFAAFSEGSPTTFITKKAYPGGSTVTFSAFVPDGIPESTWWGIAWTTNRHTANIYDCASTQHAKPLMNVSVKGKWATYSVTLPNTNQSYYLYLGGPAGYDNWNGKTIKVDDFVIKNASGKVLANEGFDNGYENSIFAVTQPSAAIAVSDSVSCQGGHKVVTVKGSAATCTEDGLTNGRYCEKCGKVITTQTVIPSKGGHVYNDNFICKNCGKTYENIAAKIQINQLNESGLSDFITKKAYPGGSTVKVRVKAPAGTQWWGFAWTTDPSDTNIYNAADGSGKMGKAITNSTGDWQTVTFTLPNDKNNYYVYVGGPRELESVLVDDFTVTKDGKTLETCDFDKGVTNSAFNVTTESRNEKNGVVENYVWEHGHTIVVDPAVAATCTTAGKTEGKSCSVCGKVIAKAETVPALRPDKGHEYVDGECIHCHAKYQNRAVGIYTKNITEEKDVNFITKKKYPGGTTVTFDAFVPKGTSWWGLAWTTDPAKASVYEPAYGNVGKQLNDAANNGKWATYSVTLPDDGKEYYVYFGTSVGEVGDKPFLLDNFKFTKGSSTLDTCAFDDGITTKDVIDIFNITETGINGNTAVTSELHDYYSPCKNGHTPVEIPAVTATCTQDGKTAGSKCSVCGEIFTEPQTVPATGHRYNEQGICEVCGAKQADKAAAIYIDQLTESGRMNFITKRAYHGGSTVTFKALVPLGVESSWWVVGFTTDPNSGSLYKWTEGAVYGKPMTSKFGEWAQYTVTLPDTNNDYYIYFVGAKGEWKGKALLIDDFTVTENSTTETDNFNDALSAGLFDVVAINPQNNQTAAELQELTVENMVAALRIDSLSEAAPMSFITKDAYDGGSVVSFKAFVPSGATWWAVCYTTDPADTDLYKWSGHSEYGQYMVPVTQYNVWANYEVALPPDDKKYYVYIVGAKGEWGGKSLLIDDFSITTNGVTVSDDFNAGTSANLFNTNGAVISQKK